MSQKHQRTLDAIFTDPVSSNIHWREIESLLRSLGARVEPGHGARFRVVLNGMEGTLHRPHHTASASKQDVRHLRDFLARCGIIGHPANHS
jgi:hypothetical protein